jgi:phosphoribosylanthranilate isomerase
MEPTSPRYVGASVEVMDCIREVGPYVMTFAVYGHLGMPFPPTTMLQFTDGETEQPHVRAIRVKTDEVVACEVGAGCRGLLLDAYDPLLHGGTGKTVDWLTARAFMDSSSLPVILAGGLTPENVRHAIEVVRPYGVDVSSGVESAPGIKDVAKMRDFVSAVRG